MQTIELAYFGKADLAGQLTISWAERFRKHDQTIEVKYSVRTLAQGLA